MSSITITTSSFGAINSTVTGQAPATITLAIGTPGPAGATGPQGSQGPAGPAGPTFTGGDIAGPVTMHDGTNDSEMSAAFFGVELSSDTTQYAELQYNSLTIGNAGSNTQITPAGVTFPDATVQSSAAFVPGSGNLDMAGYEITNANFNSSAGQVSAQNVTLSSGGSITFGDSTVQTTAFPGFAGYATESFVFARGYATLASPTFSGDPKAPTPATSDNDTSIATTAFVKAQGYLTSAPVTSVAGRTGAVTLANTDISGLGTMSTATAANYSTTTVANGLYYPLSGNPSAFLVAADISGKANLASPALTGTPTSTTAAASTNTTQIATTAFVLGQASSTTPVVDGTATIGTATTFARADHIHPTDTTRAPLASPTLTGTPSAPTATASTNTTQIATTAFVVGQAGTATPVVDGTAAVGSSLLYARQDHVHPTDTSRAPLASPTFTGTVTIPAGASISGFAPLASPSLTGTPLSTTAAVDTNTTQIATTAYVVGQGYAKLASPTFTGTVTIPSGASISGFAPLASPTFTGTPTLPTGTIATTQTAGDNTTKVATTAFVTAAVPAFATMAQSQQGSSTTTAMSPFDTVTAMMTDGYRPALNFTGATSGTGASNNIVSLAFAQTAGPNVSTAGYAYVITNNAGAYSTTSASTVTIKFNKPIWISGVYDTYSSTWQGDANTEAKAYLGVSMLNGDDPTGAAIGWWKLGGASTPFNLMVHDGTTLTKVASASSTANSGTPFRWLVYSDGAGNVTLYINGVSVATTTAGPTGATQANTGQFTGAVKAGASAATRMLQNLTYPKIYVAPQ